jgi:hypothetical protein
LRMIILLSAIMPRIATKPIGVPVGSNAITTPIRPNDATLITRNSIPKLRVFSQLCAYHLLTVWTTTGLSLVS